MQSTWERQMKSNNLGLLTGLNIKNKTLLELLNVENEIKATVIARQ